MTRKIIIALAVVALLAGVFVWALWPQADVRVFSVVASPRPFNILVTVTNSSRTSYNIKLASAITSQDQAGRTLCCDYSGNTPSVGTPLSGGSSGTFEMGNSYAGTWRVAVLYGCHVPSFFDQRRGDLAEFAENHDWPRVAQWIQPGFNCQLAYGPEMLCNLPVAAGKK